jgi:hypothetical protein
MHAAFDRHATASTKENALLAREMRDALEAIGGAA